MTMQTTQPTRSAPSRRLAESRLAESRFNVALRSAAIALRMQRAEAGSSVSLRR